MNIFFKPNPKDPEYSQATKLTKTLSIICTAGLLNVLTLPAQAAAANERAKEAYQAQHSLIGDNAYDKLVNLTAKYELEQQSYQQQRQHYLSGRSIFKKTIDGITSLFTDDNEVVDTTDPELLEQTREQIQSLQQQLTTEQRTLIATLRDQTAQMQQAGFDRQAFLDHRDLILEVNKRYQTLQGLLKQVAQSQTPAQTLSAITALNTQLQQWQPPQSQTDVENLPWGAPNSEVREPIVSEADSVVLQNANYTISDNHMPYSAIHQWRHTEYQIGQLLLNQNIVKTDFQKVAGLAGQTEAGNWAVLDALPVEVQPADLTETPDVQITQAIKDKATELEHNPAKIYKWVHDNIQYIPTYGSIQGSDYTLQTKRGNAFDTASLLIALLRASDIPARYVYGTVDIPAKQAMDWVGGVNNIDAAQNLLGQGGVPNTALMNGSTPQYLRMEHVWVEANINAISGGMANNNPASGQTQWIPLDASYKSYTRTQGIDIAKAVPFDAQSLIDKATEGAIIDEQQGSVQNLNQGAVNQAIEAYQAQVKTYLEQNHADATVGEVLGTSSINPYPSQMLSPILPYKVKTVIRDYQTLPEGMRHYFSMSLYKNSYGLFGGSSYNNLDGPALSVKIATVDLQGKPLALSFKPATQADEDRLLGYLPKDKNGTLPNSLPTNISMTPEITLDGEILATGGVFKLGETINGKINISSPHGNVNGGTDKEVIAGEYHAIGYDLQGLSQQQLESTKETLETTKDKLEQYQKTENQTALDGLTKHDLTGAILQAGVQSYYAVNDTQDIIAQKQAGIVQYPYLTYGTFSTNLTPEYRYGIPLSVKMGGVVMDIDKILHTKVEVNNDREKLTAYNLARGPSYSLNENLVPEQLFDNPDTPEKEADGVSAVKALSIAAQQGQTIFTVTKDNYAEVLPKLSHSDVVMRDIRNGVNAGKTVTVSERPITLNGWTGTGYTILDPYSGAGAYMIGGGLDGGFLALLTGIAQGIVLASIIGMFGSAFLGLLAGTSAALITFGFVIFTVFILMAALSITVFYAESIFSEEIDNNCRENGLGFGVALGALIYTGAAIYLLEYGIMAAIAGSTFEGLFSILFYGLLARNTAQTTLNCI